MLLRNGVAKYTFGGVPVCVTILFISTLSHGFIRLEERLHLKSRRLAASHMLDQVGDCCHFHEHSSNQQTKKLAIKMESLAVYIL